MDETSKVSSKSEILAFRLTFVPWMEGLLIDLVATDIFMYNTY